MAVQRTRLRPIVAVGVVFALAGAMFAVSARSARSGQGRSAGDLVGLTQAQADHAAQLAKDADRLRDEIGALSDSPTSSAIPQDEAIAAGTLAVEGPGLTVTMTDAPPNAPRPEGVTADNLVVHQQDIQAVINALWSGGAEAMTLQGERVTPTSAFRCAGNILQLHGRVFSPPYVIRAIGDPAQLQAALASSSQVVIYQQWVDAVGLGWNVATATRLEMPAYTGTLELKYATSAEGDA